VLVLITVKQLPQQTFLDLQQTKGLIHRWPLREIKINKTLFLAEIEIAPVLNRR
jgi:hypothetical protein